MRLRALTGMPGLSPRPDAHAAIAARDSPRPPLLCSPRLTGMFEEGPPVSSGTPQRSSCSSRSRTPAIYPEPQGLVLRATIEIIFKFDGYLLGHPAPLRVNGICTVQDQL
jgi:hypothetical protein